MATFLANKINATERAGRNGPSRASPNYKIITNAGYLKPFFWDVDE